MNDDLKILNNARNIYWNINENVYCKLDKSEQFTIGNQLIRATLSIALNIREGNTFDDKRKENQFKIAIGSIEEVDECLILLKKYYTFDYDVLHNELSYIRNVLLKIISNKNSSLNVRRSTVQNSKTEVTTDV